MRLETTGLDNKLVGLEHLTDLMHDLGFVLAGQWDYDRITYDRKFEIKNDVFYLRVQGYVTDGMVDTHHATIQLRTPLLGKYYYPHGVEYGEGENFPHSLVSQCNTLLTHANTEIEKF